MPPELAAAANQLRHCAVGHTIHYYPTVDSTMRRARTAFAGAPARSGTLIVAEEQSAGQGRRGKQWLAPHGTALLSTTILTCPHLPEQVTTLPMLAAVAAALAIEEQCSDAAVQVTIKWPNDILLTSATRPAAKVAGVLSESVFKGDRLHCAYLGIGINVNQSENELPSDPAALPATSLAMMLGRAIERFALLASLCRHLSQLVQPFADPQTIQEQGAAIFRMWRHRLSTLDQPISVHDPGGSERILSGIAIDVDADGQLILQDETGTRHRFVAGEVTIRPSVL